MGYKTAVFKNTTFNAPNHDYAIWTYSSPVMTFDGCTFNASGKMINVFTDYSAGKNDIVVNVNNCTFNSASGWFNKQALNINDFNMGKFKYILNITNSSATAERDNTTCSQLFGFGGKSGNNTARTMERLTASSFGPAARCSRTATATARARITTSTRRTTSGSRGRTAGTAPATPNAATAVMRSRDRKGQCHDRGQLHREGQSRLHRHLQHKCFTAQTRSDDLDPLGHDWGEPEYSWAKQGDDWYCTAKRVCKRDASHVEEETVKASQVTTPASTTKEGEGTYTATFENEAFETQTRTETIAKLSVIPSKPVSGKPASGKGNTALPQTGDSANATIFAVALLGVVAVAGSVIARKRSKK